MITKRWNIENQEIYKEYFGLWVSTEVERRTFKVTETLKNKAKEKKPNEPDICKRPEWLFITIVRHQVFVI